MRAEQKNAGSEEGCCFLETSKSLTLQRVAHADVDLHFLQMRSPADSLRNAFRHIMQFLVFCREFGLGTGRPP